METKTTTTTTTSSTSSQVEPHKIRNSHEHLESCTKRVRFWLSQLPSLSSLERLTTTSKTTTKTETETTTAALPDDNRRRQAPIRANKDLLTKESRLLPAKEPANSNLFVNSKSMRLIEAIKRTTASYKLSLLVAFVCLSLFERALAEQLQDGERQHQQQQQQYYSHQHHQIRRILDHLANEKHRLEERQNFNQLAQLMRAPERAAEQDLPIDVLARQDHGQRLRGDSLGQFAQNSPQNDEQQQQSLWTTNDMYVPSPSNQIRADQFNGANEFSPSQQQQQQHAQFFAYRPAATGSPTTPSINRQVIAPPPFYELSFSPTNALQFEQIHGDEKEGSAALPAGAGSLGVVSSFRSEGARSMGRPSHPAPPGDNQAESSNAIGVIARNNNNVPQANQEQTNSKDTNEPTKVQDERTNAAQDMSSNDNHEPSPSTQQSVDKTIEPRQKRRIFNRILKKAEWNHLFVELSKVFLRYFLDLALKDIIGKQSGSTDTTTSRKKLDAQSELTDLLKDFVKTAISNI